jgi:hypothetical protein
VDVRSKLQLKPGQSVAVLNPQPGLVLPGVVTAPTVADADAVVAFVVGQDELGSAEQAVGAGARGSPGVDLLPEGRPAGHRSQP